MHADRVDDTHRAAAPSPVAAMPPRRSAPREAGQDWDGDHEEQSRSYEKQRVRWKGLTGGNERRVKQRQQSFAQTSRK